MKLSNFSQVFDKQLYEKVMSTTFIIYQPKIVTFNYYNTINNRQMKDATLSLYHKSRQKISIIQKQKKIFQNNKTISSICHQQQMLSLNDKDKSYFKPLKNNKIKISLINSKKTNAFYNSMSMKLPEKRMNTHKLSITQKSPKMTYSKAFFSKSNIIKNQKVNKKEHSQSFLTNFSMQFCNTCKDVIQEEQHNYFQQVIPKVVQSQYYVEDKLDQSSKQKQQELFLIKRHKNNESILSNVNETSKFKHKIFEIKLKNNKSLDNNRRQTSKDRNKIFSPYHNRNSKSFSLDNCKSIKKRIFGKRISKIQQNETNINDLQIQIKKSQEIIKEIDIPLTILEGWKKIQEINEDIISFKDSIFQSKEITMNQ